MKYQVQLIAIYFFCSIFVYGCISVKNKALSKNPYSNKLQAIKDYAFCRCLISGFEKDSLEQSDASIAVLYELSDYSITMKESKRMDSLVKSYLNTVGPLQPADYLGKKDIILKCIELYKSKMLKKYSQQ